MEQGDTAVDEHQTWEGSEWTTDTAAESPPDPGLTEPDTADLIGRDAPDPPPAPVTDPDDPSYVEPAPAAVRVNPELLLPAEPHSPDCTAGDGWCGEEAHCPPPYTNALPGDPYPLATSQPDAPDTHGGHA